MRKAIFLTLAVVIDVIGVILLWWRKARRSRRKLPVEKTSIPAVEE